jgi:hypothetical protein
MQNKNILGGITWGMAASMMAPVSVALAGKGAGPERPGGLPYVLPSLPYDRAPWSPWWTGERWRSTTASTTDPTWTA